MHRGLNFDTINMLLKEIPKVLYPNASKRLLLTISMISKRYTKRCRKIIGSSFYALHKFIYCRNQQLTNISIDVATSRYLTTIDFSHNRLDVIPRGIYTCYRLEELNLSKNNISYIDDDICNMRELQILIMSNNPLTELPTESILKLRRLYKIIVYKTFIAELPLELVKRRFLTIKY